MILLSARFCRFCHHRLRQVFDYTPMYQDDQGQSSTRSKIVLESEKRGSCQSSSASPAGTAPRTHPRRPASPKARSSSGHAGRATTCRPWRSAARPQGPVVQVRVGPIDRRVPRESERPVLRLRGTHACTRTCGHGHRSRAGAIRRRADLAQRAGPLRSSASTSGNH